MFFQSEAEGAHFETSQSAHQQLQYQNIPRIPTRQLPGLGKLDEIAPQQSWHMEPIISQPADSILHLLLLIITAKER